MENKCLDPWQGPKRVLCGSCGSSHIPKSIWSIIPILILNTHPVIDLIIPPRVSINTGLYLPMIWAIFEFFCFRSRNSKFLAWYPIDTQNSLTFLDFGPRLVNLLICDSPKTIKKMRGLEIPLKKALLSKCHFVTSCTT